MALLPTFKSPALQKSPKEYAANLFDRLNMVLRLYFTQIDNAFEQLLGVRGGRFINNPYGAFHNNANQTAAAINTPYVVALNTSDFSNGVTLASNKLTVEQSGIYNVQFSLQFENTDTHADEVWVWLRVNGVDQTETASVWAVPSSHGGINGYAIGACNFYVTCAANAYIELVWAVNSTTIQLEAYTSSTSPFTRPSIPSSVVTVSFVSALTE